MTFAPITANPVLSNPFIAMGCNPDAAFAAITQGGESFQMVRQSDVALGITAQPRAGLWQHTKAFAGSALTSLAATIPAVALGKTGTMAVGKLATLVPVMGAYFGFGVGAFSIINYADNAVANEALQGNEQEKIRAISTLVTLGMKKSLKIIEKIMKDESQPVTVRQEALEALLWSNKQQGRYKVSIPQGLMASLG